MAILPPAAFITICPREEEARDGEQAKPVLRLRSVHMFDEPQNDGQPLE